MKKLFSYMMVCGAMMTAVLGFTSCEDDLDVQQAYPFTVETMPVPKRLVQGETAEIRCEIVREGYFSDTRYTIRYFQPDGEGTLRMDDGMVLLPNDRYPLDRDVFRLYYTSECEDQQTIDVYFEDNHDQLYQLTFTFNNEAKDEGELIHLIVVILEIYIYRLLVLTLRGVVQTEHIPVKRIAVIRQ